MNTPYQDRGDHIRVAVRLTPNGGGDRIEEIATNAAGETYIKARVSAVPEKGKANKALVALFARGLGVAKSDVSVVSGDTSRQKVLRIDGDPEDLIKSLMQHLKA